LTPAVSGVSSQNQRVDDIHDLGGVRRGSDYRRWSYGGRMRRPIRWYLAAPATLGSANAQSIRDTYLRSEHGPGHRTDASNTSMASSVHGAWRPRQAAAQTATLTSARRKPNDEIRKPRFHDASISALCRWVGTSYQAFRLRV
jgi:hypothetical protein